MPHKESPFPILPLRSLPDSPNGCTKALQPVTISPTCAIMEALNDTRGGAGAVALVVH